MAGRHRRTRGPNRNELHSSQEPDQSSNRTRPPRRFGPLSQDGPRRRSNAQTSSQSSGLRRSSDNSNPMLNARFRTLKRQSDIIKRELEGLIASIDEMQPDSAAMDWSRSEATVVYVPVSCALDGTFQHPQMRSVSTGEWPDDPVGFRQTLHLPQVTRQIISSQPSPPTTGPTSRPGERTDTARDVGNMERMTTERRTEGKETLAVFKQTQTQGSKGENASVNPASEQLYRGQGGGISNSGSQRPNQTRPTIPNLPTPPSSPLAQRSQARRESCGM